MENLILLLGYVLAFSVILLIGCAIEEFITAYQRMKRWRELSELKEYLDPIANHSIHKTIEQLQKKRANNEID